VRTSGRGPATIMRAADTVLRRLGTDHLDLYYLDRFEASLEESVATLARLVEAGKVGHIGLFDVEASQLRRAHAIHPVTVVGAEYSLLERSIETELLLAARSLDVGVVAYRPLGQGVLTGVLTSLNQLSGSDRRRHSPRFWPENFSRARAVAGAAERVAARRDLSAGRIALAWLLSRGDDIVALPATGNLTHLEMNLAAADIVLSLADRAELNALVDSSASGKGVWE
jgi:aryl-alcohol dehydrogenase-like predicted oxidoreductase